MPYDPFPRGAVMQALLLAHMDAHLKDRGDAAGYLASGLESRIADQGAYADLLVVDGNPLEDLGVLERDGAGIPVVMKGGEFHRNRLEEAA